ncbi:MAG: hypothetical protein JST00_32030 [Deltaproteobacteria bacterium]|nr:hypothetical protein [Deltaproteobacteria bacterium]
MSALSSTASAERTLRVEPAPSFAAARTADARHAALKTADFARNARLVLARVSPFVASKASSVVITGTERFGDGDALVHFEQSHRGLPVVGRGATVRMNASGSTVLSAIDLEEDLPTDIAPKISTDHAADAASKVSSFRATKDDAHLVVWPLRGGGSRLAYAVLPQVPAGLPFAPRVIVDAVTGKVIEARDLTAYAKANVFRFNPTKTSNVELLDLPIAPTGEKLTSAFVTSMNCIDRKTVKKVNLFGFNADMHVCDLDQLATADASGDFLYTPKDAPGSAEARSDEFSEVSMYYHTATAIRFFQQLQGVADAQVTNDKPIRVVANLQLPAGISSFDLTKAADPNIPLEPFSNAFFSPAGGQLGQIFQQLYGLKGGGLWFGQGPQRDYAYDGDVVYHELGHAIVDKTLRLGAWHIDARGAIDSPGAMNEGLADYFSSAITGDGDVGEYASKDLSSGGAVIRTLTNEDKCPGQIVGEVHLDSTLFSGGLWEARTALAPNDRVKMDAALYKAMRSSPGNGDLGFDDLAKLFLATLKTDLPAGATALETAMTKRGVLPSCERIVEWQEKAIKPFMSATGGYAAPGLQMLGISGDTAPGMIQVHAKLPAGSGKVTVNFTSRTSSSGGGSPLGGGGTPFTPALLVKTGKPITWSITNTNEGKHDAEAKADFTKSGTKYAATVEFPQGASDLYLQIVNKGESDGVYDDITVQLAPSDNPITDPPAAQPPPAGGAPVAASEDSGCSTNGGHGAPGAGAVMVLGALAALVRRRRK